MFIIRITPWNCRVCMTKQKSEKRLSLKKAVLVNKKFWMFFLEKCQEKLFLGEIFFLKFFFQKKKLKIFFWKFFFEIFFFIFFFEKKIQKNFWKKKFGKKIVALQITLPRVHLVQISSCSVPTTASLCHNVVSQKK